jgi:hypothetical protein
MDKQKTPINRRLSLAIQESMMGRRCRLTERVAVHALVRDRIISHDHRRDVDSAPRFNP